MDASNWRFRALLEPRGFIRFLEMILAIVAFATTGGYSGSFRFVISACNDTDTNLYGGTAPVSYPFRLDGPLVTFEDCYGTPQTTRINGDLSPSAQWFVFVGVTAFLYALASIIFYVIFDAKVRAQASHDRMVTIGDLVVTALYAFFWLTAASAWAWGLNEVKWWTAKDQFTNNQPLRDVCMEGNEERCTDYYDLDYGPLNASVAFAFLNFFLWSCNVWFVYKESPYHQEPGKSDNPAAETVPPNNM